MIKRVTLKQIRKILVDALNKSPKVYEVNTNEHKFYEDYPDGQISVITQGNCHGCGACDECQDPTVFTFVIVDVFGEQGLRGSIQK